MRPLTGHREDACAATELKRAPLRQRRLSSLALSALVLFSLTLSLQGCVVYPKFAPKREERGCRLISRSLRLNSALLHGSCQSDLKSCLIGILLIGGSSTLVSGSIVLVGNTLHWLERKGRCG